MKDTLCCSDSQVLIALKNTNKLYTADRVGGPAVRCFDAAREVESHDIKRPEEPRGLPCGEEGAVLFLFLHYQLKNFIEFLENSSKIFLRAEFSAA
jgi:hypothetical protein